MERNTDTSETVLHGLGDIHVDLAIERIARKFELNLDTALPNIAYRETVGGQTSVSYKHKKQSGGHGQYGHVVLDISPGETGKGITFDSKVVGGNVPKDYIPAVEKGVRNAASSGVVAGFPVVDVAVMLQMDLLTLWIHLVWHLRLPRAWGFVKPFVKHDQPYSNQ